jgi:hypothetical protein
MTEERDTPDTPFCLEESTIEQLHEAIRAGQTNCVAVVQHYIERARAYNGVASVSSPKTARRSPRLWVRCVRWRRFASRP